MRDRNTDDAMSTLSSNARRVSCLCVVEEQILCDAAQITRTSNRRLCNALVYVLLVVVLLLLLLMMMLSQTDDIALRASAQTYTLDKNGIAALSARIMLLKRSTLSGEMHRIRHFSFMRPVAWGTSSNRVFDFGCSRHQL